MKRNGIVVVLCLLAGSVYAEDPAWMSMTSPERIQYANKLTNSVKGSNAAKDYKRLEEKQVLLPLVSMVLNDDSLYATYNELDMQRDKLPFRLDWSKDTAEAIQKYLDLNKEAGRAYKKASSKKRLYIPLDEEKAWFSDATTDVGRMILPGVRTLPQLAAAAAANRGDWKTAYDWNLCQHAVIDHVMQPGYNSSLYGRLLEVEACRQLLVFLHANPPANPSLILKKIRKNDDTRCSSELQSELGDMYVWDRINAWHTWNQGPDKMPEFTEHAELYFSSDGIMSDVKSMGLMKTSFTSIQEFRDALKKTDPKTDWKTYLEAKEIYSQWMSLSYPEQVEKADEYIRKYQAAQNKVPALALEGNSGTINRNILSRRGQVGAYRAAVETVLALLDYKNKNKAFPDKLEQLVPKYLDELPEDPCTERPLIYKPAQTGDDFILYSVGQDMKNDGGKPGESDAAEQGDLVFWPRAGIQN